MSGWEALEEHCNEMCAYAQHDDDVEHNELLRRLDALRARVAELEAPPVVPEGWTVSRSARGWIVSHTRMINDDGRAAAYRAGAWAIDNDQRPAHAEDDR